MELWSTIVKKPGIDSVFWAMMWIWDANMTVLFSSWVWNTNTFSFFLGPNGFLFAVSPHEIHVWWITIFTLILWTAASLQTHTRQADRDVIYFRKPRIRIVRKINRVTVTILLIFTMGCIHHWIIRRPELHRCHSPHSTPWRCRGCRHWHFGKNQCLKPKLGNTQHVTYFFISYFFGHLAIITLYVSLYYFLKAKLKYHQ